MATTDPFLSFATLKRLVSRLYKIRTSRAVEIQNIADVFGNPFELAKLYIEPDCQHVNPADFDEGDPTIADVSSPIFKTLCKWLKLSRSNESDGRYHYFVLSDAGMGKTSLLCMIKFAQLTSFWPKGYECELLKLGKTSIEDIGRIKKKNRTVLLLDALDEDPLSWGRFESRISEIMEATLHFHRTIISCRTQFFPQVAPDYFKNPGKVVINTYRCPLVFLSLFDRDKIEQYLDRRFQTGFLPFGQNRSKKSTAQKILDKMGTLQCRPFILSHIEDIVEANTQLWTEYSVYESIVEAWLTREAHKMANMRSKKAQLNERDAILCACFHLACNMQISQKRTITSAEVNSLRNTIAPLGFIEELDIEGRSLLNKNSQGNYRFSHYSIQEFLVVKSLFVQAWQYNYVNYFKQGFNPWNPRYITGLDFITQRTMEKEFVPFMNRLCGTDETQSLDTVCGVPWTPQMTRFARCVVKRPAIAGEN